MKLLRYLLLVAAIPLAAGCAGGLYGSFLYTPGNGVTRAEASPPVSVQDISQPEQPASAAMEATAGAEAPPAPLPVVEMPSPSPRLPCRQVVTEGMDAVYRSQTITVDTTLAGRVLVEGSLTVAPQATLTVAAGTVVHFRAADSGSLSRPPSSLLVEGRLEVKGTATQPVIFTSTCTSPSAGDWQGIILLGSEKRNIMEWCRIEAASTGLEVLFSQLTLRQVSVRGCETGLRLQESLAAATAITIRETPLALYLVGGELEMINSSLTAGKTGIRAVASSLYLADSIISGQEMEGVAATESRIKLQGNTISGNGNGLVIAACQGSLTSNRLNDNRRYGLQLQGSPLRVSGNELARNGLAGLRTTDGLAVAWGNALFENGRYDLELSGSEDFRAPGNWWQLPTEQIQRRINDGSRQQGVGMVIFNPPLARRPALHLSGGSGASSATP